MAIESQESSVKRQEPVRDDRQPASDRRLPAMDRFARRVVIEHLQPEIDAGRFPIKRTVGEIIDVSATIFADRHDVIVAVLQDRHGATAETAELAEQGPSAVSEASALNRLPLRETAMTLAAPGTDGW